MARLIVSQFRSDMKAQSRKWAGLAYGAALRKFNSAKTQLINDFEEHKVTQELREGPNAINYSKTLGGYGNLYSFIGFGEDRSPSDPITPVREELDKINLPNYNRKDIKIAFHPNAIAYGFPIENVPTIEELEVKTPLPWLSGRSWLKGIEKGISGLAYYLFRRNAKLPNSYSGPAIQVHSQLAPVAFTPIEYMSQILRKFKERIF